MRIFGWLILVLFVVVVLTWVGIAFRIISLPGKAVNNTITAIERSMTPEKMLLEYRWFHDTHQQLKIMPAKIAAAKEALAYAEEKAPTRASARQVELTGLTQVCNDLVAEYNSKSSRLDAGFFKNPERILPLRTEGYERLPVSYETSYCL